MSSTYLLTYVLTYLLTYILTYLLTPCSTVLLEKLNGFQLVKNFLAYYGTRRYITAFTSAPTCSYPEPYQSSPYPPTHFLKIHLNIILPSTPGPSKWPLFLRFPTITLHMPFLSIMRAICPAHLILLDLLI